MRTPSGAECAHYYEDFNRGSEIRRCRVRRAAGSGPWRPSQCRRCPIPAILRDNGDARMQLTVRARKGPFGFGEKVDVEAWCTEHALPVADPHVGCPECAGELPRL